MSRAYPARGLGTSSATGSTFSMTALIRQRTKTASITLRTARQPRHCNNMHTRRGTKLATTFMYFCHFVNDKFKNIQHAAYVCWLYIILFLVHLTLLCTGTSL